jgi:hypothetical protein
MHKLSFLIVSILAVASVHAGEAKTWTISTGTNTVGSAYANPFVGEIDSIAVYTETGTTGTVTITAIDPYSSKSLVLATNDAATEYVVWTPRIIESDNGGSTALVVTNSPSAERFNVIGERLLLTVADATSTGTVFRALIKTK